MLLCLFTLVACSDQNNEMYITGPELPELDHEPSVEELENGLNNYPSTFKADKQAKIWFKATPSDPLYGYAGDVYVHIGINDWMYVPSTWGDNTDEKFKATKVADNIWSFTLAPTIREWFGSENASNVQNVCIIFRSDDAAKQTSDMFINVVGDEVFIPADNVMEACPETEAGIHPSTDGRSVTFVMYDKDTKGSYKDYVCLIGDFNDWKLTTQYQMKRDNAQGFWWYTLDGLNPAQEYGFQYYVGSKNDGNIRVGDAYCEKILDGSNDSYISATTYPNLKAYPAGKTIGLVSVFQTQPATYSWQNTNFTIQNPDNLVIYELLLRDFTTDGTVPTGDLTKAMAKLDYLKAMGVNAIELMPVQEFDGNNSWGYNPCYFFAMDKAYGTKEMYKQFIDACHQKGMAVLLDVVYNHATGNHPFAKLYWNSKTNKTADNNPWFNVDAPHPYSVFQDFNHESPLVREFVKRNLEFLLNEYKFDGFRFDLTKGFTQKQSSEGTASNKDDSRIAILTDYYNTVHTTNPNAVMILEHFCNQDEESALANAGMKLWHKMNAPYYESAMGFSTNSSFEGMNKNASVPGWVSFMESHDEQRTGYKQVTYGTGAIKASLETRMKQLQVNAAFFLTISGPKMLWQFGELGYDYSINTKSDGVTVGKDGSDDYKTDPKPVKWDYLDDLNRKGLYDTYCDLLKLRNDNPELFNKNAFKEWRVGVNDWNNGRYLKLEAGSKKVIVAGNFTDGAIEVSANFGSTGTWYELRGDQLNVSSSTQNISVPANEFRLYTNFQ